MTGAEVNWGLRFSQVEAAEVFLKQLSEEVAKRLADVSEIEIFRV